MFVLFKRLEIWPLSLFASLLMAVAMWLYVSMNSEYTTMVDLPLTINLPEGRALETPIPEKIRANVRGKGWQLFNLMIYSSARCAIFVSDQFLPNGETQLKITKPMFLQSVRLPSEVYPSDVMTDSLEVLVGVISQKKMPLVSAISVLPRKGFMLTGLPRVEPDSIILRGNMKILEKINRWETEHTIVSDVFNPLSVSVRPSDSLGNILQIPRALVNVRADIQQMAEITMENIPVEISSAPPNHTIALQPTRISVTVRGGIHHIAALLPGDIRAVVEYGDILRNSSGILVPHIFVPTTVTPIQIQPARVYYTRRIFARR